MLKNRTYCTRKNNLQQHSVVVGWYHQFLVWRKRERRGFGGKTDPAPMDNRCSRTTAVPHIRRFAKTRLDSGLNTRRTPFKPIGPRKCSSARSIIIV